MASDHSGLSGHHSLSSVVHEKPDTHRELPSDSHGTWYHQQSEEYRVLPENHARFGLVSYRLQISL